MYCRKNARHHAMTSIHAQPMSAARKPVLNVLTNQLLLVKAMVCVNLASLKIQQTAPNAKIITHAPPMATVLMKENVHLTSFHLAAAMECASKARAAPAAQMTAPHVMTITFAQLILSI